MENQMMREQSLWHSTATPSVQETGMTEAEQLAAQARLGSRQALRELCQEIGKKVLFSVKRLLPRYQDAEDVAQEALIRVCENIHTLKDPKAFSGWLHSIILNEVRKHARESTKQASVLYLDEYADDIQEEKEEFLPQEYALREEEQRLVMEIVDMLPARQREAILLHYYEGMSVIETASVMKVTHQGASLYLKLAREKIAAQIQKRANQPGGSGLGVFAALPLGPLVAKALQQEAARVGISGSLWAQQVAEGCVSNALDRAKTTGTGTATAATVAVATTALGLKVAGIVAGVALAVGVPAVAVGLNAGAPQQSAGPPPQSVVQSAPQQQSSWAQMGIVFSGGDPQYGHLNPTEAKMEMQSGEGVTGAQRWEITPKDGTEVLFSGEGSVVEEPFAQLESGEYRITFTLVTDTGDSYTRYSSFQIL